MASPHDETDNFPEGAGSQKEKSSSESGRNAIILPPLHHEAARAAVGDLCAAAAAIDADSRTPGYRNRGHTCPGSTKSRRRVQSYCSLQRPLQEHAQGPGDDDDDTSDIEAVGSQQRGDEDAVHQAGVAATAAPLCRPTEYKTGAKHDGRSDQDEQKNQRPERVGRREDTLQRRRAKAANFSRMRTQAMSSPNSVGSRLGVSTDTLTRSVEHESRDRPHTSPPGVRRMGQRYARVHWPPAAALGLRVGGGLGSFFSSWSEAQVSPLSHAPAATKDTEADEGRDRRNLVQGRLPLLWSWCRPARAKGTTIFTATPAPLCDFDRGAESNRVDVNRRISGSGSRQIAEDDFLKKSTGSHDPQRYDKRGTYELGRSEGYAIAADASSATQRLGGTDHRTRDIDVVEKTNARIIIAQRNCRSTLGGSWASVAQGARVTPSLVEEPSIHNRKEAGGGQQARKEKWPDVYDDEADPAEWALDQGDRQILATAKRKGSILVRVVTWNLHAKPAPAVEELREALLPPGQFHIYAVGTEECQHSIAKSMVIHSKKEWESTLKETLGASYEMLCGHALQATHNAVFAHRALVPLLRNIRSAAVATGLSLGPRGATLGNKGGVGVSFELGSTSCVFVNSHLAAHQQNVRERNENFVQISAGLAAALGPLRLRVEHPPHKPPVGGAALGSLPSLNVCPFAGESGGSNGDIPGAVEDLMPMPVGGTYMDSCSKHQHTAAWQAQEAGSAQAARPWCPVTINRINPGVQVRTCTEPSALSSVGIDDRSARSCPELPAVCTASGLGAGAAVQRPAERKTLSGEHIHEGVQKTGLSNVFDRVFWAGDLNYRVNVPRAVADVLLEESMHSVLLKHEQLSLEKERTGPEGLFAHYREGPLNFRPTYKFDHGTDIYDSSPKQRVPAWTDRVIFASATSAKCLLEGGSGAKVLGDGIELRAYRSIEDLRTSDHRPVIASFTVKFDSIASSEGKGDDEPAITNQTSSEVCTIT